MWGYLPMLSTTWWTNGTILIKSYQDEEEAGAFDGHASSFPKDFGYGAFDGENDVNLSASGEQKPRILLMGLRRQYTLTIHMASVLMIIF